jgi:hypothetical protein
MTRLVTPFTEANALLAVIRDDIEEARRIIATMLPGERRQLSDQAWKLAELIDEYDQIIKACNSRCCWDYRCTQSSNAYILLSRPNGIYGVCQQHRADAHDAGFEVHEPPTKE